ncbi:MAG: acyl-CoA thioesterase [Candidatus Eisenbacteria bacterium]|uniref:Acyl-CoA thioesterase n=1 Tax=Eiseniibacteriota bacterium TaxID=2212470 RepID=A0A938BPS6_UNCEI|nr:acyl-CoA thioesterase [Candidatus Eisenbacteria bacterium]
MTDGSSDSLFVPSLRHDPARGRLVGSVRLRVRYAESDRMGIVYNAHYLTWFEIGRTELLRSAGKPYRAVEEAGLLLPLVEAALRLRAPVRYDDLIQVETWVETLRSRSIVFAYRIVHDRALIAEGTTTHACVRAADNRATTFPERLREALLGLTC